MPSPRLRRLTTALAFAATIAIAGGVTVAYVDDFNLFELDGNAIDHNDSTFPGADWSTLYSAEKKAMAFSGIISDVVGQGDDILTGGSTKDTIDISQWLWKKTATTSVQDKDDIAHAYAAAYKNPKDNHLVVYFGADRYANSGDAVIGFWFFQDPTVGSGITGGTSGGKGLPFNGTHSDDDLLILSDFTQGGAVPIIAVYKWEQGALTLVSTSNQAECDSSNNGTLNNCAIVNGDLQPSPWAFLDKVGSTSFRPGEFFEGAVDLTVLFGDAIPCFTRFMAETRSSTSPTSTLSDFVLGEFPLCKLTLNKACGTGDYAPKLVNNGTQVQYTFKGTVKNDGVGTLSNVYVEDTIGGIVYKWPASDADRPTLGPGETADWFVTVTTSTLSLTNSGAVAKGAVNSHVVTSDTASSDPCTMSVTADMKIDKSCTTSLVPSGSNVVVKVGFSGSVCNIGDVQITGIGLTDFPASADITLDRTTLNPAGAKDGSDCTNYKGTYLPSAISSGDGTVPGRYFFDDEIGVTSATAALGTLKTIDWHGTKAYAAIGASCPICPPGLCPVVK